MLANNAGVYEYTRIGVTPLTRAEAHHAAGNVEMAKVAIREARDDLLERAEWIEDPKYRKSFLERVPVHARTMALAKQWLVD